MKIDKITYKPTDVIAVNVPKSWSQSGRCGSIGLVFERFGFDANILLSDTTGDEFEITILSCEPDTA